MGQAGWKRWQHGEGGRTACDLTVCFLGRASYQGFSSSSSRSISSMSIIHSDCISVLERYPAENEMHVQKGQEKHGVDGGGCDGIC